MTDSDVTKPERAPVPRKLIPLDKLEEYAQRLNEQGEREAANDALVLQQLITSLRLNAERDLLMAQMAARFDTLEKTYQQDRAIQSAAYQSLVSEFRELQRQQAETSRRTDVIAAIVDAGVERISTVVRRIENLSEFVKDSTEP